MKEDLRKARAKHNPSGKLRVHEAPEVPVPVESGTWACHRDTTTASLTLVSER